MKLRILVIALILGVSAQATADFKTISTAYELALQDMRVPATPSSGVVFRTCKECDMQTLRVTPNTEYRVGDKSYSLKDFRARVLDIRDRTGTAVTIVHHHESDVVIAIKVYD